MKQWKEGRVERAGGVLEVAREEQVVTEESGEEHRRARIQRGEREREKEKIFFSITVHVSSYIPPRFLRNDWRSGANRDTTTAPTTAVPRKTGRQGVSLLISFLRVCFSSLCLSLK